MPSGNDGMSATKSPGPAQPVAACGPAELPAAAAARLPAADLPAIPPATLLGRPALQAVREVQAAYDHLAESPLRLIEHFACTGGTLIARCLAALPNAVLLSEIDPLSTMHLDTSPDARPRFAPTDILAGLRHCPRAIGQDLLADVFLAGIVRLRQGLMAQGRHLVLRGHAHSRFCTDVDPASRPGLHDILLGSGVAVRTVVTLRHPLDSFLGLTSAGFASFDLDGYARRYLLFLDAHAGFAQVRYEEFVAAPAVQLSRLANLLALPFDAGALERAPLFPLSGNSGRRGDDITARPRRFVSPEVQQAAASSAAYAVLCDRLSYDPAPDPARTVAEPDQTG